VWNEAAANGGNSGDTKIKRAGPPLATNLSLEALEEHLVLKARQFAVEPAACAHTVPIALKNGERRRRLNGAESTT
jgi:hypothetical protein